MSLEHTLSSDQLANLCRAQMAAFDLLPQPVRAFMRETDIPLDAVKMLTFVRQFGAAATISACRKFVEEWKGQHPVVVGKT
jgi:hypothetical protein